jgi:hypothetical protein
MFDAFSFILGCVAKLLLWPLDVADALYVTPEDLDDIDFSVRCKIGVAAFMVCWYAFFVYGVVFI